MVIGAPFLFTRNGKILRFATLFIISPCWLVYNACVFSIAGVLTEGFNIPSIIVSFLRSGLKSLGRNATREDEKSGLQTLAE